MKRRCKVPRAWLVKPSQSLTIEADFCDDKLDIASRVMRSIDESRGIKGIICAQRQITAKEKRSDAPAFGSSKPSAGPEHSRSGASPCR